MRRREEMGDGRNAWRCRVLNAGVWPQLCDAHGVKQRERIVRRGAAGRRKKGQNGEREREKRVKGTGYHVSADSGLLQKTHLCAYVRVCGECRRCVREREDERARATGFFIDRSFVMSIIHLSLSLSHLSLSLNPTRAHRSRPHSHVLHALSCASTAPHRPCGGEGLSTAPTPRFSRFSLSLSHTQTLLSLSLSLVSVLHSAHLLSSRVPWSQLCWARAGTGASSSSISSTHAVPSSTDACTCAIAAVSQSTKDNHKRNSKKKRERAAEKENDDLYSAEPSSLSEPLKCFRELLK